MRTNCQQPWPISTARLEYLRASKTLVWHTVLAANSCCAHDRSCDGSTLFLKTLPDRRTDRPDPSMALSFELLSILLHCSIMSARAQREQDEEWTEDDGLGGAAGMRDRLHQQVDMQSTGPSSRPPVQVFSLVFDIPC
ncbi:hypothetical protein LIA77_12007 [Sarocladium implicatum]|nr:hypothetical protein LIA77_12007 [Sarocladium implicatum]